MIDSASASHRHQNIPERQHVTLFLLCVSPLLLFISTSPLCLYFSEMTIVLFSTFPAITSASPCRENGVSWCPDNVKHHQSKEASASIKFQP